MTANVSVIYPDLDLPDGHVRSMEIVRRADITYRQLDYWTRTGRLRAAVPHPSNGYSRSYPTVELGVAIYAQKLLRLGFSVNSAFEHARTIAETGASVVLEQGLVRIEAISE